MQIDGNTLTINNVIKVARNREKVELSKGCIEKIEDSRRIVEKLSNEKVVYGLNTGFGEFARVKIKKKDRIKLQLNLLRSHSCGIGKPLSEATARATMLLRANTLAKGNSGVRIELIEKLIELLNKDIYPHIPEKGSVGSSGDLVPLAHMSLLLIGEGRGYCNKRLMSGKNCLKKSGIKPIKLREKEGLALINGTPVMTAIAALAIYDSVTLLKAAEIACAMSIEALLASNSFLLEELHRARNIEGQIVCARNLRELVEGSEIIESHRECRAVQDSYSLRCSPQVIGSFHEALKFSEAVVKKEINSACDNPLIFDGNAISGGNFHGEPIAQLMDFFAISLAEIGNISERRIFRCLDENLSNLPPSLVENSGLNNGFMMTQYVAASLVSENKVLCHPASVDSIPTAANQEDHVSMGTISARKAREVLENVKHVVAIELLVASQALDFRRPLRFGAGSERGYNFIRDSLGIKFLEEDRSLANDIKKVADHLEGLVQFVEEETKLEI